MPLRDRAPTVATVITQLDSVVHAFPHNAREGANELIMAVASYLVRMDLTLRADIDNELTARGLLTVPHAVQSDGHIKLV